MTDNTKRSESYEITTMTHNFVGQHNTKRSPAQVHPQTADRYIQVNDK